MVLKAKANDRRKNLALRHDEFRGLWSDVTVDQGLADDRGRPPLSSDCIRFVGGIGVHPVVKGCRGDVQDKTAL
ncbi:hypothetical protein TNCV_2749821 [Trichonephila clavipes]|nr:hypothetical protein TNCV_2749821 [Trichonephila clavipes]